MDVSELDFQTAVLDRSRTLPVVVDFWAEWCGPCRALGPLIERAVAAREGKVELAKVDVDANPRLAQTFRIQGIPAVKAFRDGEVVAQFTGAQPQQAIERFFDSLLPSEADRLVELGDEAYTGAGSVITHDIPPGALGVARERQRNIENYAARRRDRAAAKDDEPSGS